MMGTQGQVRRVWRVATLTVAAAVVLASTTSVVPTQVAAAEASNWVLQDGGGLIANRFGSSDSVFITGVQTGGIFPASDVFVTQNQDWTGLTDVPLADVSNPDGIPNTVVGMEVIEQPIYLPYLRVGSYDVVIDGNQDHVYSSGVDQVIGESSLPGFRVFFDGNATVIDKARLKQGYADPWRQAALTAYQYSAVVLVFEAVDIATGAASVGTAAATWYSDGGIETAVELGSEFFKVAAPKVNDEILGAPSSKTLRDAAEDFKAAADGIAADPPDPNFTSVAPYEPPSNPQDETYPNSPFREFAVMTNRIAEAGAYSWALLHAVERFDGANLAGDTGSARLQANAMAEFSDALTEKLAEVDRASVALAGALRLAGALGGLGADRDQVMANVSRLRADGFTADEIQRFTDAGFSTDQIASLKEQILAIPVDSLTADLVTSLDAFDPITDEARQSLFDLRVQALNVQDAPLGQPPVANPDILNATTATPAAIDVLANDSDPEGGALTVIGTSDPAHGTASCSASGLCQYTSVDGYDGADSFTYTVSDADKLTATGTVSVTVSSGNHNPVAVADAVSVAVGGTLQVPVIANDTDPDGDALVVASASKPTHGEVTCPTSGTTCAYTSLGTYVGEDSFTYTVSDGRGGTAVGIVTVTVVAGNQPPTVEVGPDRTVDEGAYSYFAPESASDPDGSVVGYSWSLGDGRTDTSPSFWQYYPDQGVFTVTLTVTDDLGSSVTDSYSLTVENVTPTVNIGAPTRVPPRAARPLSASGYDPGADPLTYRWDFGDGSTAEGSSVNHSWESAGSYNVTVTVDDGDGGTGTGTAMVEVSATKADAGPDVTLDEGGTVTLGGPQTTPEDAHTSFSWDFGDGTTGSGRTTSHNYDDEGTYQAILKVTDDATTDTDEVQVTVRNVAPSVAGVAAPVEALKNAPASFRVFASDPGPADKLSVTWDFGDGTTSSAMAVDHAFAAVGIYTVNATVNDGDGGQTSASRKVRVVDAQSGVPDSYGREFWLAFDANYEINDTTALTLYLTAPRDTAGLIEVPGLGVSLPFTVTADEITAVGLPTSVMLGMTDVAGSAEPRAIHVSADDEVVVYGLNRTKYTTDAYLGQPVDTTGTRYRVSSYGSGYGGSEFSAVATRNATSVTVTPSAAVAGHAAGEPFTVKLDVGEAIELRTGAGDLTGSLVTSDKPVAVSAGTSARTYLRVSPTATTSSSS